MVLLKSALLILSLVLYQMNIKIVTIRRGNMINSDILEVFNEVSQDIFIGNKE